jgi:hypothetical protein
MRPNVRTLLWLSPLVLAAGALCLLQGVNLRCSGHQGLSESWPLMALDQSLEELTQLAARRSAAKRQVILALLDGQLTLRQAAAQFQDIDATRPAGAPTWRSPQYTEEEWPYRQVLNAVHVELANIRREPARADEWVARLEGELAEHLSNGGASRLHRGQVSAGRPDR